MEVKIEESWKEKLKKEFKSNYFEQLVEFIKSEYQNHKIYPPAKDIFNAFNFCPFNKTRHWTSSWVVFFSK